MTADVHGPHHHHRREHQRIFARDRAVDGPSWRDLVGEGLAVLRGMRHAGRRIHLGPVPLGDGHPVIVLPAFLCSDHMSRGLREWLTALGYAVEGWGARVNIGPTARTVAAVDAVLQRCTEESGRKASLVGYSLGGVLARALASANPDRVRRVITVCSPFRLPTASPLEPIYRALAPLHSGEHLMLEQLTAPPPVPTTAIYSPRDGVVAWQSCIDAPTPGRENIAVDGAHSTMLANPRTLRIIAERLALPDPLLDRPIAAVAD
ncbi:MAG TPA: alpha/beta fold hydrolase [Stellaceae bacterium]|nr:alpha/beta fold hydrolase [Stellaceae bacterium]